jgi:threonine dehydratase
MRNVEPTAADVADAYLRLRDWVVETPVLESDRLNGRVGARVMLKAECLQHGGSFKIRGALNRILQLSHAERSAGVVAFSSGNHGQAVALAAQWLGIRATIVMPADAPQTKIEGTRARGAEIVLYDREREDREAIAAKLAAERGAALVPPFDHPDVIAGQGTAALELAGAVRGRRCELEALYVPCGGGGLVAGCALAVKSVFGGCAVYAVEPAGYADTAESLAAGERRMLAAQPATLCDALRVPTPGAITFAINRRELAGAVAVDDAAVREAVALAAEHLKVVVEPSGAVALAALLAAKPSHRGPVGVVLSGGNADPRLWASLLAEHRSDGAAARPVQRG